MRSRGVVGILVDANVWYSRCLRDWIGVIYTRGDDPPFQVFWTEDIMAEVVYHLRKQHPDCPQFADRVESHLQQIARERY